jgi:hypothetical protein
MNHVILLLVMVCADGGDHPPIESAAVIDDLSDLERGEWEVVGVISGGEHIPGKVANLENEIQG